MVGLVGLTSPGVEAVAAEGDHQMNSPYLVA